MKKPDMLGDRMKAYEAVTQNYLMKKTPVIIRLDGRAFHTFTKQITSQNDESMLVSPFSVKLHRVMVQTVIDLMGSIQNAKFGYTQSDEITIVLVDYNDIKTEQWFNGNIQKIVSSSAADATKFFNINFAEEFSYTSIANATAVFDSRVFNVPSHTEIENNIIWRQNDASRNSISMYSRHFFSQKELHKKSCNDMKEMLYGINKRWEDLPTWMRRGTAALHKQYQPITPDFEMPILTQDKTYLDFLIPIQGE
jgi:tRNA(His) 5'-end guanylyltransferase